MNEHAFANPKDSSPAAVPALARGSLLQRRCGGQQIGPEFIITYMTNKDTVAGTFDVTRVKIKKGPKAAPANP
jgi:hypothetical protein